MKLLLTTLFLLSIVLNAKDKVFEIGVGSAIIGYPDYMGSKSYNLLPIAFPYIKYHSEFLDIDKNGINTQLFGIKNLKLDISASGSLPASSDGNKLRDGMDDLNFTFELGPKLIYNFYAKNNYTIDLELANRAVFETNLKMLDTQGYVGTAELKLEYILNKLEITYRIGLRYADKTFHNYYYGVLKKYETDSRLSYDAKGGYSGFKNKIGFTYRDGDWWYGGSTSYNYLKGAVYEDSPLVEIDYAIFFGLSIAYIFYIN